MVKPDWEDVGTVYDRMKGLGLLKVRANPGGISGHIFSLAVFARAARYQDSNFSLEEFIKEYCEWKNIDQEELISQICDFREGMGCLQPDSIVLLEVLSAL